MSSERWDGSISPKLSPEQLATITGISYSDVLKNVTETREDTKMKVWFLIANFPGNMLLWIGNIIWKMLSQDREKNHMRAINFCAFNFEKIDVSKLSWETQSKLQKIQWWKKIDILDFSEEELARLEILVLANWKNKDLVVYSF